MKKNSTSNICRISSANSSPCVDGPLLDNGHIWRGGLHSFWVSFQPMKRKAISRHGVWSLDKVHRSEKEGRRKENQSLMSPNEMWHEDYSKMEAKEGNLWCENAIWRGRKEVLLSVLCFYLKLMSNRRCRIAARYICLTAVWIIELSSAIIPLA